MTLEFERVTGEAWRYFLLLEGRETELSDGEVTLGRSRTATVRVDHESVSRSHALLTFDQGRATVKDLNSSNGTFVRGRRVLNETRLVDGDRIQLGAAVLELRLVAPPGISERTAMIDPALLAPKPPPLPPAPPAGATSPDSPPERQPEPPAAPASTAPARLPAPPGEAVAEAAPPAAPAPLPPARELVPPPLPQAAVTDMPMVELSASDLFRDVDQKAGQDRPVAPAGPSLSEALDLETLAPGPGAPPAAGRSVDESLIPQVDSHVREPLARPELRPSARDLADVSLQMSSIPTRPMRPPSSERAAAFVERRAPSTTDAPRSAAAPLARLASTVVDAIILGAFDLVGFSPVFLILFFRTELKAREAGPDWILFFVALLSSLVVLGFSLWYVAGGWARRGRTPGQAIVGLSVVRRGAAAGQGIGWDAALRRTAFGILGGLALGAGFWLAFFRADRRAWHDLKAETWVVKTP